MKTAGIDWSGIAFPFWSRSKWSGIAFYFLFLSRSKCCGISGVSQDFARADDIEFAFQLGHNDGRHRATDHRQPITRNREPATAYCVAR